MVRIDAFVYIFLVTFIIFFVFLGYMTLINWLIFKKAGKPGWVSIIPIYGNYVLTGLLGEMEFGSYLV